MMIDMTSSPQLRGGLRLMKMPIPDSIYHIATMNGVCSSTKTFDISFHLIHLLLLGLLKPGE